MENQAEDQPVLNYIQRLVAEEHRLHKAGAFYKANRKRLEQVQIELDQCWDLLRQRRALRDVGLDPNEAEVRPPQVVENYEQKGLRRGERMVRTEPDRHAPCNVGLKDLDLPPRQEQSSVIGQINKILLVSVRMW